MTAIKTRLSKAVNISTKRTAVNVGALTAITYLITKFTGWEFELTEDDLAILIPILTVVGGFGYRLSRALTTRFPVLGWVLFGSGKEPTAVRDIQKAA